MQRGSTTSLWTWLSFANEKRRSLRIDGVFAGMSWVRHYGAASVRLFKSKELFVGRQDSDDIIYSRFQTLVGQIKTWSVPFAQGQPNLQGDISTAATEYIRRVAPGIVDKRSFEGLLERPKNIRLFVRGYVGSVMADTLFRTLPHGTPGSCSRFSGTDVWMNGRLVQPVSVLEETLFKAGIVPRSTPWVELNATLHRSDRGIYARVPRLEGADKDAGFSI